MVKNECREWVFDLTDFKSANHFKELIKRHGLTERDILCNINDKIKPSDEHNKGCYSIKYRYSNEDKSLILETANDPILGCFSNPTQREPEKGYASYMGISGDSDKVNALVQDIRKATKYIKDESKCRRDFI